MNIRFPKSLDGFQLGQSNANRNTVALEPEKTIEDIWYILEQLEKKIGIDSSADSGSMDNKIAVLQAFIAAMQALGVTASPTFTGLKLTGFILTYGSTAPIPVGKILIGDGTKFIFSAMTWPTTAGVIGQKVASDGTNFIVADPTEGQNNIMQPVSICPPINASSTLTLTSNSGFFVYIGRIPKAITTIDIMYDITTALTSPIWAEVAVFKGPVVYNGAASLSRLGFTNVVSIINSTGIKKTTISLTGVSIGDDLWLAIGNQNTGTTPIMRATVADELQQGVYQTVTGQLSTQATPVTTTLAAGNALVPWMTAKW
jgi:hypothetical protein